MTTARLAGWTEEEEVAVVQVWDKVMQALPNAGIELFAGWYSANPDVQKKFRFFKNKTHDELLALPRICSHSTKILSNINAFIICRDKPGAIQELLNDVRRDHTVPSRRVTKQDYQSLVTAVVQFLIKTFGQQVVTDVVLSGLGKLMSLMEEYCVVTDDPEDQD